MPRVAVIDPTMPFAIPMIAELSGSHWPVLTGSLAILMLFFTWWQQARYRRRIEAAHADLSEHQQLIGSILENISEGIFRSSPDRGLIFVNRAYMKMFGYASMTELRAVPREQLYADPADRTRLLDELERTGTFKDQEVRYRRKDGTTFWGWVSSIAVFEPGTQKIAYHVGAISDISARKEAEDRIRRLNADLERRIAERTAELRESEARWRTLVDHAPEAIVVFDADDGRFLAVNENALKLYGLERKTLLQLTPADVSPTFQPDGKPSAQAAAERIAQVMRGEEPVFEWVHQKPDGRRVPCEVRLVRLPTSGRNLVRASVLDNTERQRREKVQRATYEISEAVHTADDLDSLFERVHSIIRTLMPAANFYLVLYDSAIDLFRYVYHVDQFDPIPAPRKMESGLNGYVLQTGKALLATYESMTDPKSPWHFVGGKPSAIWLGVPLALRGMIIGLMAVQDYENPRAYGEEEKQILIFVAEQTALAIERKRIDQALRESEAKHRALFEASSQGVMLQDENVFLDVNPAAVRILGFERESDLIGKSPIDTAAPVQPNGEPAEIKARRHIADCLAHGSTQFEWLTRDPSGREFPLEVVLTRIPMGGRPLIQAVIVDISERKKAEAELLKSLAREKELSALKSNFVSMVSHEFRTPLGVIMSSAEILKEYFERLDAADRAEHLQSIVKNTRRMSDLMEEVLLLSRVEAGKLEFEPQPLDLASFCRRLIDELLSATSHRCPIELELPPYLPDAQADERLLRHILTNLVSNAVKYSPAGQPVRFHLSTETNGAEPGAPGGSAIFEICDRGIGIAEGDRKWLFSAFHRGRNVGNIPGTGLGLTIVKRCVDLHRGTIEIESPLPSGQKGTRVIVRVPLQSTVTTLPSRSDTVFIKRSQN